MKRRCPISLKKPVPGLLPSIVRDGERVKEVKNLGWLIRNWRIVESFDAYPHPPTSDRSLPPDIYLVARLRDGRTYETGYCCVGVMREWLQRSRTLRATPITYHGAADKLRLDNPPRK